MKCGECTLCCELLPVHFLDKPPLEKCKFAVECQGCSIYKDRPEECSSFDCMYFQSEKISEELRPDKCHVIFEKLTYKLVLGTKDSKHSLTESAKRQIVNFAKQGFSVAIVEKGKDIQCAVADGDSLIDIKNQIDSLLKQKWQLIHQI